MVLLAAAAFTASAEGGGLVPLRRFALIAGSNNGGPTRTKLRYAATDARSFAAVLTELGGVKDADMILLIDPDCSQFEAGLKKVQQMICAPAPTDERRELLIYYSGHSNEEGLILGMETLPYDQLRKQIVDVPADVRVAVLDSCASGALTRAKGGTWRPAFLYDSSTDMQGHAFLTSSSAEESAQESDKIGASFFTHYLVSGLRGAADANSDGLVTLNEAYAFAFQETLASTEKTQYGPQHPAYDISLTGSGDLVLTDLRAAIAGLTLAEDVSGRISIRDEHGTLAVELNKIEGQRVELGLSPGKYEILLDKKDNKPLRAEVRIASSAKTVVDAADLSMVRTDRTVSRGDNPGGEPEGDDESKPIIEQFGLTFIPRLLSGLFFSTVDRHVSINILAGTSANMTGFEVGSLFNIETRSMTGFQASGLGNIVLGPASGVQLAGIGSLAVGDAGYFQSSGVLSIAMKDFSGAQLSGVVNVTGGDFSGYSSAGVLAVNGGDTSGFMASGVASLTFGGLTGFQSAGVLNVAGGPVRGAQAAGVLNWSSGQMRGAQVSGVGNYAGEVKGAQVSVINVAGDVSGVQVGLINIAGTVKGTQVGLINISRVIDGVPVGLLNFEAAGRQGLEVWCDTAGTWHAGFKLGSRYVYTLFSGSYTMNSNPISWAYGLGVGGHIPLGPFYLDVDASMQSMHIGTDNWYVTDLSNMVPQLRAEVGLPILGLKLSAGVAVDLYIPGISTSLGADLRAAPTAFVGVEL